MILHPPFEIGPRLAPALRISNAHNTAWLSFDEHGFVIDLPNGDEHRITDYRPGAGATLPRCFVDILDFLNICAESRRYARSRGKDEMDGKNSGLFPANVGEWAEQMNNELVMLRCEIEESDEELILVAVPALHFDRKSTRLAHEELE